MELRKEMEPCNGLNKGKEARAQVQPEGAAVAAGVNLSNKTSDVLGLETWNQTVK